MNTLVYQEEWMDTLQMELDEANKYDEICNVEYTDEKVLHNPYQTDITVQSGTRGSAYTHQFINQTDETITINQFKIAPVLIDRADLAQSKYTSQMQQAERQGVILKESIETAVYAAHAQFTDFGDNSGSFEAGTSTQITVSASNIDDIVRGVQREILEANGSSLAARNGIFFVWRPADFELLMAYAQANGFSVADDALNRSVTSTGYNLFGATHYTSNLLAANHVFAGVKNVLHLGICRSTFGQVIIDQEPAISGGAVSGVGVVSRVDYAVKAWNNTSAVLFDINVS